MGACMGMGMGALPRTRFMERMVQRMRRTATAQQRGAGECEQGE